MKQIFDWMREQIKENTMIFELETPKVNLKGIGLYTILGIINEAEAKWESDCCEWKYDDVEDFWETSCGHLQILLGGTPEENEYGFCPYCGKPIKISGVE